METVRLKKWQNDACAAALDSRITTINSPTGSGKSTAVHGIAAQHADRFKVLIGTAQCLIKTGLVTQVEDKSEEVPGEEYEPGWVYAPKVLHMRSGRTLEIGVKDHGSRKGIKEFLERRHEPGVASVATHASLVGMIDEVASCKKPVFLILDEAHYADGQQLNRLAQLVKAVASNPKNKIAMTTATLYRRNGGPDAILGDLAPQAKQYINYWAAYLGKQCRFLKEIRPEIHTDGIYSDLQRILARVKSRGGKAMIFLPSNVGRAQNKMEWLANVTNGIRFAWPMAQIHELVTPSTQAQNSRMLTRAIKRKRGPHPDVVIALQMGKLGFDWPDCSDVIQLGARNSLVEVQQIIGRATRDVPSKLKSNGAAHYHVVLDPTEDNVVGSFLASIYQKLTISAAMMPNASPSVVSEFNACLQQCTDLGDMTDAVEKFLTGQGGVPQKCKTTLLETVKKEALHWKYKLPRLRKFDADHRRISSAAKTSINSITLQTY